MIEEEIVSLKKSKEDIAALQQCTGKLETFYLEGDQRSHMNNIEIKRVPTTSSENLFNVVTKIDQIIGCPMPREQINYIARIPSHNGKQDKNIICSILNCYLTTFVTVFVNILTLIIKTNQVLTTLVYS
ncbi:unnamed protein product [Euphydryas editha]|uniref:Uncharacterized protein n=1 Tax=Euphydryas editha TaxID=104508 RepID=A0AAU9U7V9_EUPED|nr:unnamed protein product [Euphydryas editha]